MTVRVPFIITEKTISFFARQRMYNLSATAAEFGELRAALQTPIDQDHDLDVLVALCDVRHALALKSRGEIVFDEQTQTIVWQGQPLANIWVDKILDYRQLGEDYTPIWNALGRLVKNPTPEAVQRLPIFLERTALGFLPDGRFLAFKGVDNQFYSKHQAVDGSRFRHLIGDVCEMPREAVDADPNVTCSRGLHVGAPGYVKQHYSGATDKLVLCAVGPEDVVAVPTDYNGEKMRVCKYTVIDHLAQDYSDELLGSLRGTESHGYTHRETVVEASTPNVERGYDEVVVGDVIIYESDNSDRTFAVVIDIDNDDDTDYRINVREPDGDTTWVSDGMFEGVVAADDIRPAMVACVGALVRVEGHPIVRDGDYTIATINFDANESLEDYQDEGDDAFFRVVPVGSRVTEDQSVPVTNGNIMVVNYEGEHLWPRLPDSVTMTHGDDGSIHLVSVAGLDLRDVLRPATRDEVMTCVVFIGDLVELNDQGHPPAGIYPVLDVCPTGVVIQTLHDGMPFVGFDRIITVQPGNR
jgi:hypothetical protein